MICLNRFVERREAQSKATFDEKERMECNSVKEEI